MNGNKKIQTLTDRGVECDQQPQVLFLAPSPTSSALGHCHFTSQGLLDGPLNGNDHALTALLWVLKDAGMRVCDCGGVRTPHLPQGLRPSRVLPRWQHCLLFSFRTSLVLFGKVLSYLCECFYFLCLRSLSQCWRTHTPLHSAVHAGSGGGGAPEPLDHSLRPSAPRGEPNSSAYSRGPPHCPGPYKLTRKGTRPNRKRAKR